LPGILCSTCEFPDHQCALLSNQSEVYDFTDFLRKITLHLCWMQRSAPKGLSPDTCLEFVLGHFQGALRLEVCSERVCDGAGSASREPSTIGT
jgi:hypothetical protein